MATITLSDSASVTFGQFRMDVAMEMRDGLIATATEPGQASVFFDTRNLTASYDTYQQAEMIYLSSANPLLVGTEAVVDSSDPSNGSITFTTNLVAEPQAGDRIFLLNIGAMGFRKQIYDYAIQKAVRESWPAYLIPIVDVSLVDFDGDDPVITIPAQFRAVHSLYTLSDPDTDRWREVPRLRVGSSDEWGQGYVIDAATRTIQVAGEWRDIMGETTYRIGGYASHPIPVLDTDPIAIDAKWLMWTVKASLAERRAGTREWDNWAAEYLARAEDNRGRILTARKPNTVFLP